MQLGLESTLRKDIACGLFLRLGQIRWALSYKGPDLALRAAEICRCLKPELGSSCLCMACAEFWESLGSGSI